MEIDMAKQGMRRERYGDIHGVRKPNGSSDKNEMKPVPEIQGKAKTTKEKASPIQQRFAKYENIIEDK